MEEISTLILLNFQVYQASESVMMKQRVQLFSSFGPILFLLHQSKVMDHSWVLAVKKQRAVFISTKKTKQKQTKKKQQKNF